MTTRRQVLTQSAGVIAGLTLAGCSGLDTAQMRMPKRPAGGYRLPIRVGGKLARTIDVHAHCIIPQALAMMGADANGVLPPRQGSARAFHRD